MVTPMTRREMLVRGGGGFGALALAELLGVGSLNAAPSGGSLSGAGASFRIAPKAKSCIFLFMEGGPSSLDTFDPKPKLNELAGQPLPSSFKAVITPMGEGRSPLLGSKRKWAQHGQ